MNRFITWGLLACVAVIVIVFLQRDTVPSQTRIGMATISNGTLTQAIGIETLGGVFTTIIPANDAVPTQTSIQYATATDNQPAIHIRYFLGNEDMAHDNQKLTEIDLSGFGLRPAGQPQITITISVDTDGIIWASAAENGTPVTITTNQ